jgi:hypothetical protein
MVFSAAIDIHTKIRYFLNYKTNCLCFLGAHFIQTGSGDADKYAVSICVFF